MLFDAPPSIGHNLQRAVDEIAAAEGVSNKVTHLVYSHHHADHGGASSLFGRDVARIGHEETRRRGHRGFRTTTTTFQIMQSLRLDRGHLGPVHP